MAHYCVEAAVRELYPETNEELALSEVTEGPHTHHTQANRCCAATLISDTRPVCLSVCTPVIWAAFLSFLFSLSFGLPLFHM